MALLQSVQFIIFLHNLIGRGLIKQSVICFSQAISICLAILAVLALSYLGIMISWGLAFGLPWILAYFYFVWICPAHQVSMGIRSQTPVFRNFTGHKMRVSL